MNQTVTLNGKSYNIVGKPEDMPMRLFNPARKLTRLAQKLGNDEEAVKAFFIENVDSLIDVADEAIQFALGEKQFQEAQEDINNMNVIEFCSFGINVMNMYSNVAK